LQIFHDLRRQHVGRREVIQVGKGLIFDPEVIEACLVTRENLVDGKAAETAVRVFLRPGFRARGGFADCSSGRSRKDLRPS
jgi:hypothetical protein